MVTKKDVDTAVNIIENIFKESLTNKELELQLQGMGGFNAITLIDAKNILIIAKRALRE